MQPGSGARRSALPYQTLAGVEPVTGGWLVAPGNLQGIHLGPQTVFVVRTLAEVIDYTPSYTVVALHSAIGAPQEAGELRSCDVEARRRLGARGGSVMLAPNRALLATSSFAEARRIEPGLDAVRWATTAKAAESIREVQSWRQRSVWEVHPELAFMTMHDGHPLPFARRSGAGRELRRHLITQKLPGSERILDVRPSGVREDKLLDALADLWTARRIIARAITRMSGPPAWDDDGVRMDIVS